MNYYTILKLVEYWIKDRKNLLETVFEKDIATIYMEWNILWNT